MVLEGFARLAESACFAISGSAFRIRFSA